MTIKVGRLIMSNHRFDKDTLTLINQLMVLKGIESLKGVTEKTGVPLAGLREWLKAGDDLMLQEGMRDKLFAYIGFDIETGALSTDRIHNVRIEKGFFGCKEDRDILLKTVLSNLSVKLETVFEACELVSDNLDGGGTFARVRRFFLCSKKGKQRIHLTVKATTKESAIIPVMEVLNLGGEDKEIPKHKVGDIAEAIETYQLSPSEFDSVFFKGHRRNTFKDVENLCRANDINPDELIGNIKKGLRKARSTDNLSIVNEEGLDFLSSLNNKGNPAGLNIVKPKKEQDKIVDMVGRG